MIDRIFDFVETWLAPVFMGGIALAALARLFLPGDVEAAIRAAFGI